jgi:cell division protein FtsL
MATLPQIRSRQAAERSVPRIIRPGHLPGTLIAGLALLVLAAVGLLQVLQTSRAATAGYELRALEDQRQALSAEVRLLEAEVAQQVRVEQIRKTAIERLGMVPPQQTLHITVDRPAPASMPLPERYVVDPQPLKAPSLSIWEQLLRRLPGFN